MYHCLLRVFLWPLLLLTLVGCTSLPLVNRQANASEAIAVSTQTKLGRIASGYLPEPLHSGFRLLPLGSYSLDTRVELARRSQVSLDVQYYHFEPDETGRWLLRAMRDAAERGVRVRLLIDDFYTSGQDEFFLAFAAHPNVEVRLFNPFLAVRDSGKVARFIWSVGDWKRVNHRMHNKLFIADGAMAVIGGRNVSNEYYLRSASENFIDVDAFVTGFLLGPLQGLFDRYWNAPAVYPLQAIASSSVDAAELRRRFDESTGPANTPPPAPLPPNDLLGYGPIRDDLDDGRLGLIWAYAYVFADHPDKPFDGETGGELMETSVTFNVFEAMRKAQTELVITSPYLVPGDDGMQMLSELARRKVLLVAMTNSLGATDEPVVHLGYRKYREDMLDLGVDLYEISSSRTKNNLRHKLFGSSLGRLHSKVAVVDRKTVYIGSMNLDPRSATINTELGAVIESPQLAREMLRIINVDRLQSAYRVTRKPGGGLYWAGVEGDQEMVYEEEPEVSLWLRFKLFMLAPLVPHELL
ncbi:MAG TPA: phospholipase D family protein [Rubrivivax sp.]|nr:phospholipase D family protein [Rubrivivax sp.]